MKEKVLLADVMRWLKEAMEKARRDPGDITDTVTALSYRELRADIAIETGRVTAIFVRTSNSEFRGDGWRYYRAITKDGVMVNWEAQTGVPTGADWLPWEFVKWMKGGES